MRDHVISSSLGRALLAARLLMIVLTGLSLTTACASKSPTEPGSGGTTPSPNVSIVAMSVAAETLVSGAHVYRVTVTLRESGGAAATIASIDLTFMSGSSAVTSLHVERPISDAANVLAPNATIDSRELMAMDEDPSHPHATSVVAKVNYTYGAALTRSADASAPVPLSSAPTFTLSGIVTEENTAGRAVAGGTVQVVDGPNAGKSSSTDGNGNYILTDLAGGGFSIRATATGYNATERAVMVVQDTRLDLRLLRTPVSPAPGPPPSPGSCAYTVDPSTNSMNFRGGSFTATISRTAGNCSWQASSDVSWITFPGGMSGNGSATLGYTVGGNFGSGGFAPSRSGTVTIAWAAGSARLRVQQGLFNPDACDWTVVKGPQDFDNVPSAGGKLTATVVLGSENGLYCQVLAFPTVPWITLDPGSSSTMFTFSVAANSGPPRNGSVLFQSLTRGQTLAIRQQ